jgi:PPIC-type PPIASE domain
MTILPFFCPKWTNLFFLLILFFLANPSHAWTNPLQKIQNDYRALTRRVTARHILLPPNSDDAILELKRSIMRRIDAQEEFVVDVFEDAAKKFSRDDTTNYRGGLLGELLPQGACQSAILDRKCFEVPLGSLQGPIESEFGLHLLLVTERTNCPKLDGKDTKLVPCPESGYGKLVPSSSDSKEVSQVTPAFLVQQAAFWTFVVFAGGILAEITARILA